MGALLCAKATNKKTLRAEVGLKVQLHYQKQEKNVEKEKWCERESRPAICARQIFTYITRQRQPLTQQTHSGISIEVKSERKHLWVNAYWQECMNNAKMCFSKGSGGGSIKARVLKSTYYLQKVLGWVRLSHMNCKCWPKQLYDFTYFVNYILS